LFEVLQEAFSGSNRKDDAEVYDDTGGEHDADASDSSNTTSLETDGSSDCPRTPACRANALVDHLYRLYSVITRTPLPPCDREKSSLSTDSLVPILEGESFDVATPLIGAYQTNPEDSLTIARWTDSIVAAASAPPLRYEQQPRYPSLASTVEAPTLTSNKDNPD
jgi:hypothetical protein